MSRAFLNLNFQKMFVGILGFFSPSFGVTKKGGGRLPTLGLSRFVYTVSQTNTCDTSTCATFPEGVTCYWGVG